MNPVIIIHGGAGAVNRTAMTQDKERCYHNALTEIISQGQRLLAAGATAPDAVCEAVRLLEECPLFNAGKGAVFTQQGMHELDASIMDGRNQRAGAVAGVRRIRNPILAAKAVMQHSGQVMLIAEGAEAFARECGLELVQMDFFSTDERYQQLLHAQKQGQAVLDHDGQRSLADDPIDPEHKFGTVGAVALDSAGNLAAATSTGGMTNKRPGRVGDSPIIGAGCYACNQTVAVSCTGTGETFMRTVAAYDVAALMAYGGFSLQQAAEQVVMQKIAALQGSGGLIAVDCKGNIALPFNSEGMYRAYARGGQAPVVAIYR